MPSGTEVGLQPFGHCEHGPKIGRSCAPFGVGELGPHLSSNTMWPGLWPTSIPSGILMHPTVGHNTPASQPDRQTDNGPIA